MTLDPNFPRWMFHRTKDPVIVRTQDELDDLGDEWSKTLFPREESPALSPDQAAAPEPETQQPRRRGRPPKTVGT